MADEPEVTPTNPETPATPATPPTGGEQPGSGTTQQQSTDVPYDRFEEINNRMKAAEAENALLKTSQKDREDSALAEQGKFEDLHKSSKAEAENANARHDALQLKTALNSEIANHVNFKDPVVRQSKIDAVNTLLDKSGITFADGNCSGALEAIEIIKKLHPSLFTEADPSNPNMVNNGKPTGSPPGTLTEKDVMFMPKEDFNKLRGGW